MACCCSHRGSAGYTRVACIYCCTKSFFRCCRKQVVSASAPFVQPGDYAGWPGWDWSDDSALREKLAGLEDGDVLLMCCRHSYGEFARVLANSKWDHVAVVVRHRPRAGVDSRRTSKNLDALAAKYPGVEGYHQVSDPSLDRDFDTSESTGNPLQDVEIFESTGDGVHVYSLVSRLRDDPKYFERYAIIALRKLECERSPDKLAALDDVINMFRGLPFEQDRETLKRAVTRGGSKGRDVSTLFCAELVAESLQALGVLSLERNSNDYLPCDFSTENPRFQVKLQPGATLEPEVIIKSTPEPGRKQKKLKRVDTE
eukprot:TRINITY_DN49775_c0_g1_i1.p1 TRINITY_DN49775_c0_g1~~TRINITY_DN49775_c0_g1_i1.p1  ORF type:complete len:314 (-),score=48.39 TRINITY_DN49775_c0_g1_i1:49-990(-)